MISSKYEGGGSMFTNLKCSMLRAKIDAVDMAEILGISLSMYKQLECGAKNPSYKTMQKFKEIFPMVDVSEIFLP